MTIQKHEIWLESDQQFEGRLPTHHLGFLMADLPIAISGAVSMALRNRSTSTGKQPSWLRKASDIRFTGHGGDGVTHLQFELPSLNDAAREVYEQALLIDSDRPDGSLTGLDLLMNVFSEIDAELADSNAFDPQLLHRISRFKRFFRAGPFTSFRITGTRKHSRTEVKVTNTTTKKSLRLYGRTPSPQRSRIVGQLDGIEASTQRFSLLLDSGERVSGVYPEDISDDLQQLWRKRVVVLGTSVFRASGNLLRVEADSIENGERSAPLFSTLPIANGSRLDPNRLRKFQGPRSGMAAIMDRWPGDETEMEISEALEQLS